MKNMFFIVALLAAFAPSKAQSTYDFSAVSSSGDTLYYLIDNGAAVVTCPGDIDEEDYWSEGIAQPQGSLVIDSTVTWGDTTYTVVAIGEYAFYGCSGITSVTLPGTMSLIEDYAFYDCINLASVSIPASVTDFGHYVFSGTALPEPYYKDSVFVYMPVAAMGVYTIPDQITYICGGAFYRCASLTHVVIPNSVTEIGPGAFLDCDGLTQPLYNNTLFVRLPLTYSGSYTIPDGILTVCASAFVRDTGLTELVMPNSVTTMGNGAFSSCTALTAVTLSQSLTAIPNFAFMGCTALTTVTLPASVGRIGTMAFRNCSALDTLVVKATVPPSITSMSFRNIPASCLLIVPCGTLEAYTEAWSTYFSQIVEDCGSQGIDDIATSDIKVYARDGRVVVEGADGQQVNVFDLMGRKIQAIKQSSSQALPTGVYMVKVGNYPARKVAVIR
jgi:hypothetical protein